MNCCWNLMPYPSLAQSSYIVACTLCQLEFLCTQYWKNSPVLQNTPTAHARHLWELWPVKALRGCHKVICSLDWETSLVLAVKAEDSYSCHGFSGNVIHLFPTQRCVRSKHHILCICKSVTADCPGKRRQTCQALTFLNIKLGVPFNHLI